MARCCVAAAWWPAAVGVYSAGTSWCWWSRSPEATRQPWATWWWDALCRCVPWAAHRLHGAHLAAPARGGRSAPPTGCRPAQVEATRWLVDIRSKTLAALPLSTAGGAVRKAAEGALDMRSILVEGDLIAVRAGAPGAISSVALLQACVAPPPPNHIHTHDACRLRCRQCEQMARCSSTCVMRWPASCRPACWSASPLPLCGRSGSTSTTGRQRVSTTCVSTFQPLPPCTQKQTVGFCLPSAGVKAVYGCNGAVWVGVDSSTGSVAPSQIRAAARVGQAVRAAARLGSMLVPSSIDPTLDAAA